MKLVKSLNHLKRLCNINGFAEFDMLLAGGICRSSKQITYYTATKTFNILNEIDDTWQENILVQDLEKETMIVEAIEKHSLFYTGCQRYCVNNCKSNCSCK